MKKPQVVYISEFDRMLVPKLTDTTNLVIDMYWPEFKTFPEHARDTIRKYLFGDALYSRQYQTNVFHKLPDISKIPINQAIPQLKLNLELEHTTYALAINDSSPDTKWIIWCSAEEIYMSLIDPITRMRYFDDFVRQLKGAIWLDGKNKIENDPKWLARRQEIYVKKQQARY